jgi:membrane protease YdiL (CAAX protease family)
MKSRALYSPEPHRGWLPWGALAPFLGFVFVIGPLLPISFGIERLGLYDTEGPVGFLGMAAFTLTAFTAVGLVALGWVHFVERRPLATIGFTRPGGFVKFVRGHLIGCASIVAVLIAAWLAGGYVATAYAPAWRSANSLLSIATLLLCFAIQGSVEEIVFRGWMLSAIARKFNVAWGVGLSSLIFVGLHLNFSLNWLDILNLVLFSLFACAWAIKKNSIWGIMGWHAGWNWLLATGFQLPVTGMDLNLPALLVALTPQGSVYLTGGHQGPEGSIACTVFFAAGMLYLLRRAD